jgi:metal-dependent amidase/aminoacylase/carboxypeptidase family protein
MTTPVEHIRVWQDEFTIVRLDLHAHPELGFEEHRTARVVCEQLKALGIEHHSGVGRTGVARSCPDGGRPADGRSASAPTWTRCRCRKRTSSRTSRGTTAACTFAMRVAEALVGPDNVARNLDPSMGSEDFAFMLRERPGAFARLGQGGAEGGCFLHNSMYDFNDAVIPLGAGYLAALAEHAMPLTGKQA